MFLVDTQGWVSLCGTHICGLYVPANRAPTRGALFDNCWRPWKERIQDHRKQGGWLRGLRSAVGKVGGHARRRPFENQLLLELIFTPFRDLLGPGEVWLQGKQESSTAGHWDMDTAPPQRLSLQRPAPGWEGAILWMERKATVGSSIRKR